MAPRESPDGSSFRLGLTYGVSSYLLWGLLPPFFLALAPASPVEIVASRVLFALVFCAIVIAVTHGWTAFATIVRDTRRFWLMGLAGALIVVNWLTYVSATTSGHVIEGSLGYFINPLVTILLGVVILRERLRPLQWIAVGIGAIAVVVLTVGYGRLPWISLVLAVSFGLYGFVKKLVGPKVDALSGLTLETAWLAPLAGGALIWLAVTGTSTVATHGIGHFSLLAAAGPITAIPLLLFAGAARRLPLTVAGLLQYIAPVLQFTFGLVIMHEAMPTARWVGFGLVWISLVLISVDMVWTMRAPGRNRARLA